MSFRVLQTVLSLTDQSSGLAESILIDGPSPGIFSGSEMAKSRPAESETTVLERRKNRKPGSSKAQNSKTLQTCGGPCELQNLRSSGKTDIRDQPGLQSSERVGRRRSTDRRFVVEETSRSDTSAAEDFIPPRQFIASRSFCDASEGFSGTSLTVCHVN
jgi:hypothetical protein